MAIDFLEEIYSESILLQELDDFSDRLYSGLERSAYIRERLDYFFPKLIDISKKLVEKKDYNGQVMWETLNEIIKTSNLISLADMLQERIIPILVKYLRELPEINVTDKNELNIISSDTGFLTVYDSKEKSYFHSKVDPMKEAYIKAKALYRRDIDSYWFFGCGLGYMPYQLACIADGNVKITVIFFSDDSITYAKEYGVLDWINVDNLEIIKANCLDDNIIKPIIDQKAEYYIFKPEMRYLFDNDKVLLDSLYNRQITCLLVKRYSEKNFIYNIRNVTKCVSQFDVTKITKDVMVVAGGPSVDDCIEFVKENKENMSVICVGTIYKRLLNEGVIPDIVTILDPFDETINQIEDCNTEDSTLVIGMDTCWKVAKLYKGDKYFVIMEDELGKQARYARLTEEEMFDSYTTVTSLAYNLACYFGANNIYLIGADFAYPNAQSHAKGTPRYQKVNIDEMCVVEDVNGASVYTTDIMNDYRNELESVIKKFPKVKCINMSKYGAKIKGSVNENSSI